MPERHAQFVMKISKYCNLRCAYCYEYRELGNKERMSLTMLAEIFQKIAEHAGKHRYDSVTFIWHGGEPFMIPLEYYGSIGELQREIFGTKVACHNVAQTNLTVLTDRHLEFLKTRKFFRAVGVSFDVYGDQRVDAQGKLKTDVVLNNLQKMINHQISFGSITVLARNTLPYVKDIYRFYDKLGIKCRFLPFYLDAFEDQIMAHSITFDEVVAGLKSIFDEWVLSERATPVDPIDEYLDYAIAHVSGPRGYSRKESDVLVLIVNVDGGVWGEGEEYESAYRFGNLAHEDLDTILTSKGRRSNIERAENRLNRYCRNCRYFGACPGIFVREASPQQQKVLEESGCHVKEVLDHIVGTFEQTGLSDLISKHKPVSSTIIPF
jgi:uncharacterized protein